MRALVCEGDREQPPHIGTAQDGWAGLAVLRGCPFKFLFRRIVRDGHKAAVVGRGIEKVDPVLARPDIRALGRNIGAIII